MQAYVLFLFKLFQIVGYLLDLDINLKSLHRFVTINIIYFWYKQNEHVLQVVVWNLERDVQVEIVLVLELERHIRCLEER